MPSDLLILTPKQIGFSILNPDRDVAMHLDLGADQQFLPRPVLIRMTSAEARKFAGMLLQKAEQAEAGPSQS